MLLRPYLSTTTTLRRACTPRAHSRHALPSTLRLIHDEPYQSSRSQPVHRTAQDVLKGPMAKVMSGLGRSIKIGAFTFLTLATVTFVIFEGRDQYLEFVKLASPAPDAEAEKWEWDNELTHWNGDRQKGGTDSGLGWKARHQIRAASTAHLLPNIAADPSSPYATFLDPSAAVNSGYLIGADLLKQAISFAEEREAQGKLHPETFTLLLTRLAQFLEKLGPAALPLCRQQYERAWMRKHDPYTAWRLGEVCKRLGQKDAALQWWAHAIQAAQGATSSDDAYPKVPTTMPSSPASQRVLTSTLLSLSAFFAANRQLSEAARIQTETLDLLRSLPHPISSTAVSRPESLHNSTLIQRASVLSLQHAEVLFAQGKKPEECIRWLQSAAESSSRVVRILAEDAEVDKTSKNLALSRPYVDSPYLQTSAQTLFNDARRTASEAWNLMGILGEQLKQQDPRDIVHCYEEALKWAGKVDGEGQQIPEVVTQVHWDAIRQAHDAAKLLTTRPVEESVLPLRKGWFKW